ncbi:GfV-C6-ORF3 [Ichnoviriform fumiferanae]|uniref:GfV-C6-ORF3 n=1 Tax=Ichnoviriform fumiferanae TaxID=419435 RepID=A2PZW8_9VIRU|nr:GfV-C6-ORF3 [Ichnoviriform fumiferanae]BAF45540.1 GfV-C6-ORF3 [Ichnoviriform fumiferanae]
MLQRPCLDFLKTFHNFSSDVDMKHVNKISHFYFQPENTTHLVSTYQGDSNEPILDSKFARQVLVWRCGECGRFFPVSPQLIFILNTYSIYLYSLYCICSIAIYS